MNSLKFIKSSLVALLALSVVACQQDDIGILNRKEVAVTPGSLKESAGFPIGLAISEGTYMNNATYKQMLGEHASSTTFGYYMKHGALVDNNGNVSFTQADAVYNAVEAQGVEVFGHTLGWHANQNATYLNSLTVGGGPQQPNLVTNPGFETDLSGWAVQNTGNPANSSSFTRASTPSEVRSGSGALKVVVDQSYGTSQWRVQIHTNAFNAVKDKTYNVSFWIKSSAGGGSIRLSAAPTGKVASAYQGDQDNIGTDWTQVTWSITMTDNEPAQKISFDIGKVANTYFIDDVKITDSAPVITNEISNPGFENTLTGWAVQNTGNPANSSSFTHTTAANEIRSGAGAMKVVVDQNYGTSQWRVQVHTPAFAATSGKTYNVSFWIKAATAGGSIRLSAAPTGGVASPYQGDQDNIGTDWTQINWSITMTADAAAQKISFDIGKVANTYFIDDVKVEDAANGGGGGEGDVEQKVTDALQNFITKTVDHYKGKVHAWDVVNEPITDAGAIRTSENTTVPPGSTDMFFWADHLGEDWILKAFQFAEAADPEALLFINDYNLEYSEAKVDALIELVTEMKEKGAKIDGIGTQMHININTSFDKIDQMFMKLAETGLLVRISELDVRANPYDKPDFSYLTHAQAISDQAVMYEYVINSYIKHVPPAQRHGVTVWGIHDPDSWIVVYQDKIDAPLLFDENFEKKTSFYAVKTALEASKGN